MRTFLVAALLVGATLFALPAAASPSPVWAGTWDTSWGPLTLSAAGTAFEGTFGYGDSWNEPLGHVTNAHADGAVLTGTWQHDAPSHFAPRDHGSFTITWQFSGGVGRFDGTATYQSDGSTTTWHGTCQAGLCSEDHVQPTVKALSASGKAGGTVTLRWQVSDDRGTTTDALSVHKGAKVVWSSKVTHSVAAGQTYQKSFRAPKTKGTLRFVVVSTDKAGNKATSSAAVTIR